MKTNERDAATALRPFFVLFLVSGACSLVYEVVWIRLSMAVYGTTTPTISTVLSVFMAGLAIGSWGAGRVARRLASGAPSRFLRMYAAAELLIGLSALTVPAELDLGRRVLFSLGRETAWQDAGFLLASGTVVAITLLPFAIAMGATFPLAMAAIRGGDDEGSRRSFGFLYAANVLGAAGGVVLCAFVMIELLGFRGTLFVAAAGNAALALSAWALSRRGSSSPARKPAVEARDAAGGPVDRRALALLFTTGFVSMAMEVVWVRMLTPYLGPVVYSFALILAIYLAATFAGSWTWRFRSPEEGEGSVRFVWVLAGALSTLILAAADPRVPLAHGVTTGALRAIVGLVPFCAVIGWLTPRLVDLASQGDPLRAGRAYAANVVGCILGPLAAGFLLLPTLGERESIVALAIPLCLAGAFLPSAETGAALGRRRQGAMTAAVLCAVALVVLTKGYETLYPGAVVRRDYEATAIATYIGDQKHLLINGVGITSLTPITKMMVHVPLALAGGHPKNALVICFGMGTSFRSALSWGIPVTAVELVPSVPGLIGFYHENGPEMLRSPNARIVIDDGRRFLERTRERFDLIVVDPPPPIESAGSSLLYSKEFCALVRSRLGEGGVFQQWLPEGDEVDFSAVARALSETFPHVRAFPSYEGWGLHFLASERPLRDAPPDELAARLPLAAQRDLMEWWPGVPVGAPFARVLGQEVAIPTIIASAPQAEALSDDRPVNEYYLLRLPGGLERGGR